MHKKNLTDFGYKLKQILTENNLAQAELAKNLNISKHTITKYLTNERKPRIDILLAIAKFSNKPVEWFFTEEKMFRNTTACKKQQTKYPENLTLEQMCEILEKLMSNEDSDFREHIMRSFKQAFGKYMQMM